MALTPDGGDVFKQPIISPYCQLGALADGLLVVTALSASICLLHVRQQVGFAVIFPLYAF